MPYTRVYYINVRIKRREIIKVRLWIQNAFYTHSKGPNDENSFKISTIHVMYTRPRRKASGHRCRRTVPVWDFYFLNAHSRSIAVFLIRCANEFRETSSTDFATVHAFKCAICKTRGNNILYSHYERDALTEIVDIYYATKCPVVFEPLDFWKYSKNARSTSRHYLYETAVCVWIYGGQTQRS